MSRKATRTQKNRRARRVGKAAVRQQAPFFPAPARAPAKKLTWLQELARAIGRGG